MAMLRRTSLMPLVLLLATMVSPVAGTPRPLESLRLIVGIAWLSDEADDQTQSVTRPAPRLATPAYVPVQIGCEPDSHALSAAIPRSRFQRPPPNALDL